MLAEGLKSAPAGPLEKEIVMVQSGGMARWTAMALADRLGVCANVTFPFPDALIWEIFQKVLCLPETAEPFHGSQMTWRLMGLLGRIGSEPGFEALKHYLGGEGGDLKRLQLSESISSVFDQYLMFRPEMILEWEAGKHDHWQARLWRRLAPSLENRHRPALGQAFMTATAESDFDPKVLPRRVCVFGVSALPPFHLDILARLSRFIAVHFFFMNPSRQYWGDIVSDWEYHRAVEREGGRGVPVEALHLEKGNSLLASLGGQGRDFFDRIVTLGGQEVEAFEGPGETSLLRCIQSDILNLTERGKDSPERYAVGSGDCSVQIHSCHGPMREMEVLHDSLLDLMERDSRLRPKDILVMTPDIETYAPYVQAVFGTPEAEALRLPFTVADRSARRESGLVDAFLAVLDLAYTRVTASDVMAILESKPVHERFGLTEPDLERIRRWIRESGIRWGIDETFRSRFGLPALRENSWEAGLDRLLLGYAMPEQGDRMFQGVLPYDTVEGGDAQVLEGFVSFCRRLFETLADFDRPRTPDEWVERFTEFVEAFFEGDGPYGAECRWLKDRLAAIGGGHENAGPETVGKIDLAAIRWYLGRRLEEAGFGHGFIDGGITFCAMLPMRSIPFKVVCLVGMDSDACPRQSNPVGFDLMARFPRRGDRSRRRDDRYLFLEALLSARDVFYMSYVGQSLRDNGVRPPSVLVSELMDYLGQGAGSGEILEQVVTSHRLQPFNPAYFSGAGPHFSYSAMNADTAQAGGGARKPVAFFGEGLGTAGEEWKQLDLRDLCRFFANPAKFLLQRRLRMDLGRDEGTLDDVESFEIGGLERYWLEQELVERGLSGQDLEAAMTAVRAGGRLPHGMVGECVYRRTCLEVEDFIRKTEPYLSGPTADPQPVDLGISTVRLRGEVDRIYGDGPVYWRYARLKAGDELRAWIHHLAAQCVGGDALPTTTLIGLRKSDNRRSWVGIRYETCHQARQVLEGLVRIYERGLVEPIPFFPETSWAFASRFGGDPAAVEAARKAAHRVWSSDRYHQGEGEDPYYRRVFGDANPMDEAFCELATAVFDPLLKHRRVLAAGEGRRQ